MSREDPILRVRVPEELRVRLKALASENHRSMNAEIVDRLELSLADKRDQRAPDLALEKRLETIEQALVPDFDKPSVVRLSEEVSSLKAELQQVRTEVSELRVARHE